MFYINKGGNKRSQINTLGPVGFNPTGEYDNTHKYERLDVVYYEGSSYVALQESIGQLPTNTEYWDCIAVGYLKQNTYDSVAEMKADDTLKDGMYAQTVGYYETNDGGGATYKITDEESESEYQEELENGLYATLIIKDYVTPEIFGAKGDGETDDKSKIQIAINIANTKKKIVYFNKKTYLVNTSLTVYSGTHIEGNKATLKTNQNIAIITSSVIGSLKINNLNFIGANNSEYTNNVGIKVVCYYSQFTNLKFTNFYQGIYLDTTGATGTLVENVFDTITFANCHQAFLGGNFGNNKITDGYLSNIIINNNDDTLSAIIIGSAAGWMIQNIHIYGSCLGGISLSNCFHTIIDNIYCESAKSSLISCSLQSDLSISNITGTLAYANNNGIALDRNSYHAEVVSANINNVYLTVGQNATNSSGIKDISGALDLTISGFSYSVNSNVTTFKPINNVSNELNYVKSSLNDKDNFLKYKNSAVSLGYKKTFSGSSETTIPIPVDINLFNYSMGRAVIDMVSKKYWDGDLSINYHCEIIIVDKNNTISLSKLNESGNVSGFTNAPTFSFNSTTNTIDVTFTPSSSIHSGYLFSTII